MAEIIGVEGSVARLSRQFRQSRNWINRRLGIDKAIGFTILARGWGSAAGLVTVALIARFLSRVQQGYYYTFGSLIALQIVFELGFSFVILQMASHERAHLDFSADGHISGDPVAHGRLASILQKTIRWYAVAAIAMVVFLLTVGYYFFSVHEHAGDDASWRLPWCAAALAVTLTFLLDPILSFMEGCGFVPHIARLRLAQAATGSTLAWLALVLHQGLFAPAMIIVGNACVAFIWLSRHRGLLLPLMRLHPGENKIDWAREVWPFQWRIAVSWLCGYFIYQLFNPVLFAYKGAVAAGQMGMSLTLANALRAVSVSWINTKSAPFGGLVARKEYLALDALFFRATRQSLAVLSAGALVIWMGAVYMNWAHVRFAQRLLSPTALGILLLVTILDTIIFAEALYLRAHKQEKFLLNSVLGALLVGLSTFFLGRSYGALGLVTGSLLIGLLMGLPLGTYTFLKYRRAWHAE